MLAMLIESMLCRLPVYIQTFYVYRELPDLTGRPDFAFTGAKSQIQGIGISQHDNLPGNKENAS